MSQLITLGLITAASALYGFVVAHHALGRSLQNRVQWQVEYRARTWGVLPRMGPERWMADILRFQGRLALFLALASVAFFLSLAFNIVFLFSGDPLWVLAGTLAFIALAVVAAGRFIHVGVTNYHEARSQLRDFGDFMEEFKRKSGMSGGSPREDEEEG